MCIYHCELQLLHFLSACSQIWCQSIHEDVLIHMDFLKPLGSSEESHQDLTRERLIKGENILFSIGIHFSPSFLKSQPNTKLDFLIKTKSNYELWQYFKERVHLEETRMDIFEEEPQCQQSWINNTRNLTIITWCPRWKLYIFNHLSTLPFSQVQLQTVY